MLFRSGIQPDAGPSLIFITLPNVFQQAFSGVPLLAYIFSVMFYILLAVAALTSTISMHEVVTAYLHEEFHLSRKRAASFVTSGCIFLGTLCSLSLGVGKGYTLFGLNLFDMFDFVTAKITCARSIMSIQITINSLFRSRLSITINSTLNHPNTFNLYLNIIRNNIINVCSLLFYCNLYKKSIITLLNRIYSNYISTWR